MSDEIRARIQQCINDVCGSLKEGARKQSDDENDESYKVTVRRWYETKLAFFDYCNYFVGLFDEKQAEKNKASCSAAIGLRVKK